MIVQPTLFFSRLETFLLVLARNVGWFFTQPLLVVLLGLVAQADIPSIAASAGGLGQLNFCIYVDYDHFCLQIGIH